MLKAYYYTTEDYNGVLVTDGAKAYDVPDFPMDGTIDEAMYVDMSGLEGCESMEEVKQAIGTRSRFFDFVVSDYDTVEEIKVF